MRTIGHVCFRNSFRFFTSLLLLAIANASLGAELSVQHQVIARSNVTSIPAGVGTFTGFGASPAIDKSGNVLFVAVGGLDSGGKTQSGVYTSIGTCCQKVADKNTLIPGGGGSLFTNFYGSDKNDIDGGRVAFRANTLSSGTRLGLYTNVGQASANTLVQVALNDNIEWSVSSHPWVDGNVVAMRGQRLIPQEYTAFLLWNGSNLSQSFSDPGAGYAMGLNTQAAISAGAAIFRRIKTGASELAISSGGTYETLVVLNTTPVPGQAGATFSNLGNFPVIDRGNLDAAFRGSASNGTQGVFKRINGGVLEKVVDTTSAVPGGGTPAFASFTESAVALANGKVVFLGNGAGFFEGIYTDIGGQLAVIADTTSNNTIVLNGVTEQITDLELNSKSFAYTPSGYTVVFWAQLLSGGDAIIKATIGTAPSTGSFTVVKDFSDNSTAGVSVTLTCTSGTVTNNPRTATEAAPAVFTISGAATGATCTASESPVPTGYTANQTDCQNGDPLNGSCTIVNTLIPPSTNSFTVLKDFSDNSTASVSVTLACTSGTVTNNPQLATEAAPAVFNISGAATGATCTASESPVPTGYTANQTDCQNGDPLGGTCTIINTKNTGSFTVAKDFSDNSTAGVSVTLTCSSGTITNNPRTATEAVPAVFNISGAATGATCTASESPVPSGYTANQTGCQNGDPIGGTCTIVNTLIPPSTNSFTVLKDFSDNSTAGVSVTLTCSSGTVTNNPRTATEATPAVFNISGAATGATCTASESPVPTGYTANQTDCQNGDPLNGTCTIVNTKNTGSFTVAKDFSDNSTAGVSVTLTCSSGTVTNNPRTATEAAPAVFTISGAATGATCTASESPVPTGYTANQTDCQNGDPLNGTCTIVNTKNTGSFTVAKDFSDNSTAGVSVTLTCTSGTVTNNPRTATETAPAVFNITGAATGATCTASESPVPTGYTANQTDCQNGDPLGGTCTIINTKNTGSFTVAKDFSDNSTAGVSVTLTCSSGTVTNNPRTATEATPAVFTISGAATGATCTASESPVPTGYTANQTDCQNGDPLGGTCTIVNTSTAPQPEEVIIYDGFEDGNANGWSLGSGTAIDGTLAIGQYSLRHKPATTSTYNISTLGYTGVSVKMNLAASSLRRSASCLAEVSTNGGSSWTTVAQIKDPQDTGVFKSGTVSPAAASNNLDLRLRFRLTGSGKGGYCYGDEVTVKGTLNGA